MEFEPRRQGNLATGDRRSGRAHSAGGLPPPIPQSALYAAIRTGSYGAQASRLPPHPGVPSGTGWLRRVPAGSGRSQRPYVAVLAHYHGG